MATTLKSPYGGALIEVADELAGRYLAAGWLPVNPAPAAEPEPAPKPKRRRRATKAKAGDDAS